MGKRLFKIETKEFGTFYVVALDPDEAERKIAEDSTDWWDVAPYRYATVSIEVIQIESERSKSNINRLLV